MFSFFSIKWKISLALILSGLFFILSYVFIAKNIFEQDKISYVFEAQNIVLSNFRKEFESEIDQLLTTQRNLISSYDVTNHQFSQLGDQIFKENSSLLGVELQNENSGISILKIEKEKDILTHAREKLQDLSLKPGEVKLKYLLDGKFLLLVSYKDSASNQVLKITTIAKMSSMSQMITTTYATIIFLDGKMIESSLNEKNRLIFKDLTQEFINTNLDKTLRWNKANEPYLISIGQSKYEQIKFAIITPEAIAFQSLGMLFKRSLVFLVFSTFCLIFISLIISRKLTLNIGLLDIAAKKIGQGNFNEVPNLKSKDEIGLLSKTMQKMSEEILRLLNETQDKVRMENELKTTRLVQESFMPLQNSFKLNQIEVSGTEISASECGGDWWYYFNKGDRLFICIADATGHGTPAALITAAARSVFSIIEKNELTLLEMMKAWDHAIQSCSRQKIFMTGALLGIDTNTGECSYLSAGHEPPYHLKMTEGHFEADCLNIEASRILGEGQTDDLKELSFILEAKNYLVLYTDGLFSVTNPEGGNLNLRRFGKKLATKCESIENASEMTRAVFDSFEEHRKGQTLPDDVTVVSIRRC